MRILQVLNSRVYSGAENVVCQIIRMFREDEGVEIAYCSPYGEKLEAILVQEGVRYFPIPSLTPGNLKAVLREFKPDIIHAHDMRAGFVAALCCGRIPLISHVHNNAFDARGLSPKSVAYLLAGFRARHIFWVSQSSFEGYRFHRLFAKKSSVLFNIIDTERVLARADADPNTYAYDAIFIGRLTYQKNPQRLVELCRLARAKKPDFRMAVVGTGELEAEVKALAAGAGTDAGMDFLGFQSNPMKMLSSSGCMILPSRWEGTPMCALEAMVLGVPVVSTPTDGLVDLIEDGVTGFLSDSDEVLADKMVLLSEDPALRAAMSRNAAQRAREINDTAAYKKAIAAWYV